MDLHLCLPLLALLLQPALCVYNCSSEYERTPGRFTFSLRSNVVNIFLNLLLCIFISKQLKKKYVLLSVFF